MNISVIKNEWLATLLAEQRETITEFWIQEIRSEDIPGYQLITDELLRAELPPTVDSMIEAFRTGDVEGPRQHSLGVIRRRLVGGMQLPDLQKSLHALEAAVMRIVSGADLGSNEVYLALLSASTMYYLVALIAAAVYEQLRTEQQLRFTAAYEFGIALSRNLDLAATLDTAVSKVSELTKAESAAILLSRSEAGHDEVRAYHNLDHELVEALPAVQQTLGCRAIDAESQDVRDCVHAISDIRNNKELEPWADLFAGHGRPSVVCAPLVTNQRRLGSLMVMWSEAVTPSGPEMDFLYAVAGHIANAVQNAILYEEAKGKRELGILLEASKLFASTLEVDEMLQKIAQIGTEAVEADLALVIASRHEPSESLHRAYYLRTLRAKSAVAHITDILDSVGQQGSLSDMGPEFSAGAPLICPAPADCPEWMRSITSLVKSAILLPILEKGELIGAFAIISMSPDAFSEEDLPLATGLADLASVALENARLYGRERNIAEILQWSILPSSLPDIDGYEAAAFYKAAKAEAQVGGDIYDAFTTGDNEVGALIGDVSGKGLQAAVPTAMAKYAVRAYASESLPPGDLMTQLSRMFCENAPSQFFTALYGVLNPRSNTFTYATAGHNPPLMYSAESGMISEIPTSGPCLGILCDVAYEEMSVHFQPGDALLMYTDGAIDVVGDSGRLEEDGLRRLFHSCAHNPAQQIVDEIAGGISDFGNGKLSDDVAIVVIKRQD